MSHLDDDLLAAVAMGEPIDESAQAHLDECDVCRAQARDLGEIAAHASRLSGPGSLLVPSPRVWQSIVAELEADDLAAVPAPGNARANVAEPVAAGQGNVVELRPRRRTAWLVAAAAAVGVIIGGVGVGVYAGRGDDLQVVASTGLTNLVTDAKAGSAHVERRADGTEVLVLSTDYHAVAGADLEVWLIDPNITGMVSLGYLTSSHAEFTIPPGYDPSAYPIVDISVEPRDGVPTHSGDSITRGTLGT